MRHGANSPVLLAQRTAEVRAEFMERYPFLAGKDEFKLDLFFTGLARYRMMDEYWNAVVFGDVEAYPRKGFPRTGIEAVPNSTQEQLTKLMATLGRLANDLGLDPTGHARFAKDEGYAALVRGDRVRGMTQTGLDILRARGEVLDAQAEDVGS